MFCSKCGKEISDDSVFCNSCGSKTIIKKTDSVLKESGITEIKNEVGVSSITDKVENTKEETIGNQNNSNQKNEKKSEWGWGWLILLIFYGYSLKSWNKDHDTTSTLMMIVTLLGIPFLVFLYYQSRKILLKRKYFIDNVWLSSFISGFLSLIFIFCIIGFSSGLEQSFQGRNKTKEINEFANSFIQQTKEYQKQELEYSKMMMSEPKTKSEIKEKILKIEEYKNFLIKKDKHFMSLINFYREINLKYKNNKSINEQVTKLQTIGRNGLKLSIDSLDMYKKYFVTGDEKYYNQYQQESNKIQLLRDEVTQLITNIGKSL